jgi:hypothetical protein
VGAEKRWITSTTEAVGGRHRQQRTIDDDHVTIGPSVSNRTAPLRVVGLCGMQRATLGHGTTERGCAA